MKVAAGAVYFSLPGLQVASAVASKLRKAPLAWFADQIALSETFSQVDQLHTTRFSSRFMDWEFEDGTAIWTGKGPRKYENPRYVAKKQSYPDWRTL